MNIREFYNRYINWIVVVLVCLVMIKGCKSCTIEREMIYNNIKTEQIIDSLSSTIISLNNEIDSLNNVIDLNNKDIEYLKVSNNTLGQANKYYRDANNTLVNTNRKLTEQKDTIK